MTEASDKRASPTRDGPGSARGREKVLRQKGTGSANFCLGDQAFGRPCDHLDAERSTLAKETGELADGPLGRARGQFAADQEGEPGAEHARFDAAKKAIDVECILVVQSAPSFVPAAGYLVGLRHHKRRRPGDCDRETAVIAIFKRAHARRLLVHKATFYADRSARGSLSLGSKTRASTAATGKRLRHDQIDRRPILRHPDAGLSCQYKARGGQQVLQEWRITQQVGIESQIGIGCGWGDSEVIVGSMQVHRLRADNDQRLSVVAEGRESIQKYSASGYVESIKRH